jgi:hypothetical protein
VDADLLGNGQPTQLVDCQQNAPILIEWDFSLGENPSVQLSGTNYCLDAGTNPHNNGPAKVWECQPGVPQQKYVVPWASSSIEAECWHSWYLTNDGRFAITGGNQCLDWTNGSGTSLQTYQVRHLLNPRSRQCLLFVFFFSAQLG